MKIEVIVNGEKGIVISEKDLIFIEDELFFVLIYARENGNSYLVERMYEAIKKIREVRGL